MDSIEIKSNEQYRIYMNKTILFILLDVLLLIALIFAWIEAERSESCDEKCEYF